MRIDNGRADIFVPEEFLHGANILIVFEKMRREAVTNSVAAAVLVDLGCSQGVLHRALDRGFTEVMSPGLAGTGIDSRVSGRKQVFPAPLLRRVRVFADRGVREMDLTESGGQILLMESARLGHLLADGRNDLGREKGDAVFRALAIAYDDLITLELDVLDA